MQIGAVKSTGSSRRIYTRAGGKNWEIISRERMPFRGAGQQAEKMQNQVKQLKKDIENKHEYTAKLLHGALSRLGYDSNEELNKQYKIEQAHIKQPESRKHPRVILSYLHCNCYKQKVQIPLPDTGDL